MAINLLPKEISQKNKTNDRGKSLTFLTYILIIIAAVVMVGGAVLNVSQRRRVNDLKTTQQELLTEVDKFQQVEAQLIVVKDRLTIAEEIMASRELEKIGELQMVLYDNMPEGVSVFQQKISEKENGYTVIANSALSLREYIRQIGSMEEFNAITLMQLTYSPLLGYQAEFQVN